MKLSSAILAVATFALGSMCVYLYTELDAERGRADAEASLRREQEARLRALGARLPGVESSLDRLLSGVHAPPQDTERDPGGDTSKVERQPDAANADIVTEVDVARARKEFRDKMADAEKRKTMVAQVKMLMGTNYPDLARQLNLSPERADQLMELLAEQDLEKTEKMLAVAEDRAAMTRVMSELEREDEVELMALLGHKYEQYQDYRDTLGERRQVEALSVQFEAANVPLSETQKRQLIMVLAEERNAKPQPAASERFSPQESIAWQQEWQREYNRRVLERMSGTLTPQQLERYEELQRAMNPLLRDQ